MKWCKKCVMPDTRPGITFNKYGICQPCINVENRKGINWDKREKEFKELCNKYRRDDGRYDVILPSSGGKDSFFQAMKLKEYDMNPLIVKVCDSFTATNTGNHNLYKMSESFGIDIMRFNLNHNTMKKMMRIAFEEIGSPNFPIDLAIYSVPLKIAHKLDVPLILYGEDISFNYGGPESEETYSAKKQFMNNVVKPIDWSFWYERGITEKEVEFIKYPSQDIVDKLEPIYLSYFFSWDGKRNCEIGKRYGFKTLDHEWKREGFIENYDQLDSVGYLLHPILKYMKFGHSRTTDMASNWIRNGYMTRKEAVKLVKMHDHKLDQKIIDDFIKTLDYTYEEFYNILDGIYNTDLFEKMDGIWKPKFEVK